MYLKYGKIVTWIAAGLGLALVATASGVYLSGLPLNVISQEGSAPVAPNEVPVYTVSVETNEDIPYAFSVDDFMEAVSDGEEFVAIRIGHPYSGPAFALPREGELLFEGAGVRYNQEITIGDLDRLVYAPAPNYGYSFSVMSSPISYVQSDGNVIPASIEYQVLPVDDPEVASDFELDVAYNTPLSFDSVGGKSYFYENHETVDREFLYKIQLMSLPTNGTLTYQGVAVTAVGTQVFESQMDELVYTPNPNYTGPDSFEWSAARISANEQTYENSPEIFSNIATTTLNVRTDENQGVVQAVRLSLSEDEEINLGTYRADLFELAFNSPSGRSLERVVFVSLPNNGQLLYLDSPVEAGQSIALSDFENLQYLPNRDYNGQDSFEWQADDGVANSLNTALVIFTITGQDDNPDVADFTVETPYDTPTYFRGPNGESLFLENATDIDALTRGIFESAPINIASIVRVPEQGDLVIIDEDGNPGEPLVNPVSDVEPTDPFYELDLAFAGSISLEEAYNLQYIPKPGFSGADTFEYRLLDFQGGGGTGEEGSLESFDFENGDVSNLRPQFISNTGTVTVQVQEADVAPTAEGFSITTGYNQPYDFSVPEFESNFDDPNGDVLEAVTLVDLPTEGTMLYQEAQYTGQEIPRAELSTLRYVPNDGFVGQDSLSYRVSARGASSQTATIDVEVTNYQDLQIVITKDTPDEEVRVNKLVCVEGTVTNPNTFALNNAVVRLTADPSKSPFVEESYTLPEGKTYTNLVVSNAEFSLTLDRIEAGETVVLGNCVRPLVQDLSTIDGVTFLEGSDRVTQGEVNLQPVGDEAEPVAEPEVVTEEERAELLVRTGGNTLAITYKIGLVSLPLVILWCLRRAQKD